VEQSESGRAEGLPGEIGGTEGKGPRLWSVSLFMTLALTAGLLAFLLPRIIWNLEIVRLEGLYVRQLLFGLAVLVLLYGIHTHDLRRKLSRAHGELAHRLVRAETAESLSLIDPLTEVFNRRYLDRMFPKEVGRADRLGTSFTLLMIDLDDFKSVNTRFGHVVGDLVLRQLAELLNRSLRRSDAVVRYGGDEFVAVLSDTDEQQAQHAVERLLKQIEEWNKEDFIPGYTMKISCGMAAYNKGANIRELLEAADQRMYQYKADDTVKAVAATMSHVSERGDGGR